MAKKSKGQRRLLGWGILGGVGVLILALFLIARLITSGSSEQTAAKIEGTSSLPTALSTAPAVAIVAPSSSEGAAATPSEAPQAAEAAAPSSLSIPPPQPSTTLGDVAVIDPAAMDQGTRRATLLKLINQGIFTAIIATPKPAKVGITPIFQGLNASLQQQFVALVYVYINNGKPGTEPLQLIDVTTQKLAGTYSQADGLKLGASAG